MTTRRVVALILGCLLLVPGAALLVAGSALALTCGLGRDSAGYLNSPTAEVASASPAVIARDVGVVLDAGTPDWVVRRLDADLRLRVERTANTEALFVGVGPADDVAAYLEGTPRDEVVGADGTVLTYRHLDGAAQPGNPAAESFWLASASGPGPLTLDWTAPRGDWVVVLMNADGAPGMSADVTAGAKVGALAPLANVALWSAVTLLGAAAGLILLALRHRRPRGPQGVGVRAAAPTPTNTRAPETSYPTAATSAAPEHAEESR